MLQCRTLIIVTVFFVAVVAQNVDISPCPRLFVYEAKSSEPNRWYGIITLLSDTDLSGVWLRITFDRPSIQIGNWFGEAVPKNENKEYLIKNREFQLKAYVPKTVRFFIEYDTNKPAPRLTSFRLNARTVCPEGEVIESNTEDAKLHTSGQFETTTRVASLNLGHPDINKDDDFFPGDFALLSQSKSNSEDCGIVVVQPTPLITYGHLTQEGEFPWHAALYRANGIDLVYTCGASLISKRYVITAGHCVTKKNKTLLDPNELTVYLGKYNLRGFTGTGIQDRQVENIILHPEYNSQNYRNDLALIKLSTEVNITDYVRPVCLWQESINLSTVVDREGTVTGWGFDQTGTLSQQLMKSKMPVVAQETCIYSYPEFFSRFTSPNSFCAGFRNGTSVCNGDSGGGMVFPKTGSEPKKTVWQLRGIVSISVALQNQKCDASNYVVFTDTAKYLDWIKTTIAT